MEFLTEFQLRSFAEGIVKLAFLAGLAGALTVIALFNGVSALAEFFANRSLKSARIRAARTRPVVSPDSGVRRGPLLICNDQFAAHVWDGDICVTCGMHAQPGRFA